MQYSVMSFQPIQEAIFLSIGMPLLFSRYLLSLLQFCHLLFKVYLNIEIISVI